MGQKKATNQDFSKLYKFKTIDQYFFSLIENNQLAFSNNSCLNDPNESMLRFMKTKYLVKNGTEPDQVKKLDRPLYQKIGNIYYFCMTRDNRSIVMWGNYGDADRGVCLEFDFSDVIRANLRFFKSAYRISNGCCDSPIIYPVRYCNKLDSFTLNPDGTPALTSEDIEHIGTRKLKVWEYEKEVRMRLLDHQNKKDNDNDNHVLWNFEKKNLKGIYFGFRTSQADKVKTVKYIRDNNYTCRFYQADDIIMEKCQPVVHYREIKDV